MSAQVWQVVDGELVKVVTATVNSLTVVWRRPSQSEGGAFVVQATAVARGGDAGPPLAKEVVSATAAARALAEIRGHEPTAHAGFAFAHTLHFLPAGLDVVVEVLEAAEGGSDVEELLGRARGRTASTRFAPSKLDIRALICPEHRLGRWVEGAPGDMMWTLKLPYETARDAWESGMFTLPHGPVVLLPNPQQRFCLRLGPEESHWGRAKKLRRHAADFRLSINRDFAGNLERCRQYHVAKDRTRSSWINAELIQLLDRCRQDPEAGVDICSIELWDGESLVAAIFSLMRGFVFHDFTMCTLVRDHRSPGSVLTKAVGHLLGLAGYRCWYWGFKNDYMSEYDSYGAHDLSRPEFYRLWDPPGIEAVPGDAAAPSSPVPGGVAALQRLLEEGRSLIAPLKV